MLAYGVTVAWYIVEIRYVQEKLAEVRPRHRDYLRGLAEAGTVALAGPFADGTGSIVLYRADSEAELESILANDPYTQEGVIADRSIREFLPALGAWLPQQN